MDVVHSDVAIIVAIQDGQTKTTFDALHIDRMGRFFGHQFGIGNEFARGLPEFAEHATSEKVHQRTVNVDVLTLGGQELGMGLVVRRQWWTVIILEERDG